MRWQPIVPKRHRGYVTVLEQQVEGTLEENNKLHEALKESDFECFRLREICNVLLGRLGYGHKVESEKWPGLNRAIERHRARERNEFNI